MARGIELARPDWRDPSVDWGGFDAVLIRTTWDYTLHRAEFLRWADRVASLTILFNSPQILRWNTHKGYLGELGALGVPVVPTAYVEEPTDLAALLSERGWTHSFLKPVVGASAEGTRRLRGPVEEADQRHLDDLVALGGAMVQPYRASVENEGEVSALIFEGRFSHAVQKLPRVGDYRVQDDYGATDCAYGMSLEERRLAVRAVDAASQCVGERPLYARVDFLRGPHGLEVVELEMVEPSLFLRRDLRAADDLAAALLSRLDLEPTVQSLPRSRARAVIFDLDGTVVDSEAVVVAALQEARATLSLGPVDPAGVRSRIGLPLTEMVAASSAPGEPVDEIVAAYRAHYAAVALEQERVFDGMLELLVDLRLGGARLGIATGKSQRGAVAAAARHRLGHWVESVHGIVPGTPGKPSPAVLLRALGQLRVEPGDAIFVGDTTFDVLVAQGAGVPVCGVTWGVHRAEDLLEAGAGRVVESVAELRKYLLPRSHYASSGSFGR